MKKPCNCQCHCWELSETYTDETRCPPVTGDNSVHNWTYEKPYGCFTILLFGNADWPQGLDFCTSQSNSKIDVYLKNPEWESLGICGADMTCHFPTPPFDSSPILNEQSYHHYHMFAHDAVLDTPLYSGEPKGELNWNPDYPKPYWYGTVPFLDDTLHLKLMCDPCSGQDGEEGLVLKIWWESGCSEERHLQPWAGRTWYDQQWMRAYTVCIGDECGNFGCRDCIGSSGNRGPRLDCTALPDTYEVTFEYDDPVECGWIGPWPFANECWRCYALEGSHLVHTETEQSLYWYGDGEGTITVSQEQNTRIHGMKCSWLGFIEPPTSIYNQANLNVANGIPGNDNYSTKKPVLGVMVYQQEQKVYVYFDAWSAPGSYGYTVWWSVPFADFNCYGPTELSLDYVNFGVCQLPDRVILTPLNNVPLMAMAAEPPPDEPPVPSKTSAAPAKKDCGCRKKTPEMTEEMKALLERRKQARKTRGV